MITAPLTQKVCPYCHEDIEGFVKTLDKNGHAVIRPDYLSIYGATIEVKYFKHSFKFPINYCPMCGRQLR